MSDILIKGMKMPKCCKDCALFHSDSAGFYGCFAEMQIIIFDEGELKPDWCPLVEVPSTDVAPVKHGRWIEYPECLRYENAYSVDHIVCSECGEVFSILDNDTERFDFCPHCGADLR